MSLEKLLTDVVFLVLWTHDRENTSRPRHLFGLKRSAPRCLLVEGYEPNTHAFLAMVVRAHSVPPEANPFWSERLQTEVALQRSRPGDLPIPQDDGEGEWEMEEETAPVQDKRTGCVGKGRGGASGSMGSNRMFVTPPSTCWRDGRGNGLGRRSDGAMPPDSVGSEDSTKATKVKAGKSTMGPMPPKVGPHVHGEPEGLQRALEAEMVSFLRDQNDQLLEEVARLRQQAQRSGQAPSSAPSSWEQVDGHEKPPTKKASRAMQLLDMAVACSGVNRRRRRVVGA